MSGQMEAPMRVESSQGVVMVTGHSSMVTSSTSDNSLEVTLPISRAQCRIVLSDALCYSHTHILTLDRLLTFRFQYFRQDAW